MHVSEFRIQEIPFCRAGTGVHWLILEFGHLPAHTLRKYDTRCPAIALSFTLVDGTRIGHECCRQIPASRIIKESNDDGFGICRRQCRRVHRAP